MILPPIQNDARFRYAIDLFNQRDYADAADVFEELFFDAGGDEIEFARIFLQSSVGLLHAERKQRRAAISRLEEAIRAIDRVSDARGVDLMALRSAIQSIIASLTASSDFEWPLVPIAK